VYTGAVNSTADHGSIGAISAYWLLDFETHYQLSIKNNSVRLTAAVKNLLNSGYETIRFYPMPGIHYQIGLKIRLK